jgi:hypothetical protein
MPLHVHFIHILDELGVPMRVLATRKPIASTRCSNTGVQGACVSGN